MLKGFFFKKSFKGCVCSYTLQVNYKDRTIIYGAKGRVHSLNELWVYDGTAWDIESGITAKVKHYKQSEDAVKDAVSEVMKKLREQEIIKD